MYNPGPHPNPPYPGLLGCCSYSACLTSSQKLVSYPIKCDNLALGYGIGEDVRGEERISGAQPADLNTFQREETSVSSNMSNKITLRKKKEEEEEDHYETPRKTAELNI